MFNDIICDGKGNEEECVANSKVVSRCCWNSQKADVLFSVQQLHCPGVSSKAKDTENCPYILLRIKKQLKPFFAYVLPISSVFTVQLQTCVNNLKPIKIDRGNLMYWWGNQLFSVKSRQKFLWRMTSHHTRIWQRYEERIKLFSQENKVSKFCMDAGFIHVVEIGQYFMTKDIEEQFFARVCRWRIITTKWMDSGKHKNSTRVGNHDQLSVRKTWNWNENLLSLRKDNSQSWVRISHGSNKFVIEIQTTATQKVLQIYLKNKRHNRLWRFLQPDQRQKQNHKEENFVVVPSIIAMNERKWIDIEPGESSFSAYEISEKVINLLRHSQTVQREDDGPVQFWRIKNFLQNQFPHIIYWSYDRW